MGKSAPSSQTVTNKTELPQWVQEAGQRNLAAAYDVSANMLGPYQGQRVAGLTPGTEQVVGNITQNAAMSQPAFAYAQQLAAQAGGYQPQQVQAGYATPQVQTAASSPQVQAGQLSQTDLAQYMNPYTKSVLETSLDVLNQQRQTGLNQAYDAAIKAKAFGGSRQAIQEGVVNAAAQQQAGQLAAQLMAQNYGQAQTAAQADITRSMEAQRLNQATASGDLGRILEAQRLNQVAASGDITRMLEAQRLNQQAGLSGAQLGIQGAGALGDRRAAIRGGGMRGAAVEWDGGRNGRVGHVATCGVAHGLAGGGVSAAVVVVHPSDGDGGIADRCARLGARHAVAVAPAGKSEYLFGHAVDGAGQSAVDVRIGGMVCTGRLPAAAAAPGAWRSASRDGIFRARWAELVGRAGHELPASSDG